MRCSTQGADVTGNVAGVANKVAGKRLAAGKENGQGLSSSAFSAKDEMPAAPTHVPHRRTESRGYDRYGDQNYSGREAVPAW
jgi:hypothetical protein